MSEISRRGSTGAKTHASGPDFFGLSDLGVTKVIQVNILFIFRLLIMLIIILL